MTESTWAIVVGAGSGRRFGGPKQYRQLGARRVLDWSVTAARSVAQGIVLVVGPDRPLDDEPGADQVVAGGATRSESVRRGLAAVPSDTGIILVHDAARPLASPALFRAVVDAIDDGADAALPAIAVVDTIRHRQGGVVDRSDLIAVQTPQGFRADVLRAAHRGQAEATDDVALVETLGGRVVVVEGERSNLKITEPADLVVASALLEVQESAMQTEEGA